MNARVKIDGTIGAWTTLEAKPCPFCATMFVAKTFWIGDGFDPLMGNRGERLAAMLEVPLLLWSCFNRKTLIPQGKQYDILKGITAAGDIGRSWPHKIVAVGDDVAVCFGLDRNEPLKTVTATWFDRNFPPRILHLPEPTWMNKWWTTKNTERASKALRRFVFGCLVAMTCLTSHAQPIFTLPYLQRPYSFAIYQGTASRTYTNKATVWWTNAVSATGVARPGYAATNFQGAIAIPTNVVSFFAATVTDLHTGLESDYSQEINYSPEPGITNVTLVWTWPYGWPTNAPAPYTNVVHVFNSLNDAWFTNPPSWAMFRVVQGGLQISVMGGPGTLVQNWNGTNTTTLSISKLTLH